MRKEEGAAEKLAEEGIECDVLDMRTIRPLDIDSIIESVQKTNRVVIVDQSWPFGCGEPFRFWCVSLGFLIVRMAGQPPGTSNTGGVE